MVLGNDGECAVEGEGAINLGAYVDGKWNSIRLEGVLYVPEIKKNLISMATCARKKCSIGIDESVLTVSCEKQVIMAGVQQENRVYFMFVRVRSPGEESEINVSSINLKTWHERLGHVGARALGDMVKNNLVDGVKLKNTDNFFCEPCQLGKAHRLPLRKSSSSRKSEPGEYVHSDVCGPIQVKSQGGASFYVTFIDDSTGFCSVYFFKNKDEVFEKFKTYDRLVENKFGKKLRMIRSDNGGEYKNKTMEKYLEFR